MKNLEMTHCSDECLLVSMKTSISLNELELMQFHGMKSLILGNNTVFFKIENLLKV